VSEPILLKHIDHPELATLAFYRSSGGYEAAAAALERKPDDIIEAVKISGLRGRGGAGFSAGMKWGFVPKDTTVPHYLCCNADEGEPGTFKDRVMLEKNPHLLLEGMIIASYAINAHLAYIYIRGEFRRGIEVMERAIDDAYAAGILGQTVLGKPYALDIVLHRGAGAYICGEETALIESIEGKKGQPRLKPPFPALIGLFQGPTVVNNVETLAAVPWIIQNGGEAYARIGTPKSCGTKLFCVSGHVNRPGVYEIELGMPLKTFIAQYAGGMRDGIAMKALIPGGSSTAVLTPAEVETAYLDYESLQQLGSALGSGAIIVIGEGTCMVKVLTRLLKFYAHESCGQCTPCREGVPWMYRILQRITDGSGETGDIELLGDICDNMIFKTICPLSEAAIVPVQSFLQKFRPEFEQHINDKTCPICSGKTSTG
jgi:NADH-quinone oxidoreductase subunit F